MCHTHIHDHECLPTKLTEVASVSVRTKSKLCNMCQSKLRELCYFTCKCGNFTCIDCRWNHIDKCTVYLLDLEERKRDSNRKLYCVAKLKITTVITALLSKQSQKKLVLRESPHDKEASLQYYQQRIRNLQTNLSELLIKKTKTTDTLEKLKVALVALITRKKAGVINLDTHIYVILNQLSKLQKELAHIEKTMCCEEHDIKSYLTHVLNLENKINELKLLQSETLQWLENYSTSSIFLNSVLTELDAIIPENFDNIIVQTKYMLISEHVEDIAKMLLV